MKHIFLGILLLVSFFSFGQTIGYEVRTNNKQYLSFGYKQFELRHKTDGLENRITYRYNVWKNKKWVISIPIQYKFEKNLTTIEPRLVRKFNSFSLWIEKELSYKDGYNTTIAVDFNYKQFSYRVGWDDSNNFRFRVVTNF